MTIRDRLLAVGMSAPLATEVVGAGPERMVASGGGQGGATKALDSVNAFTTVGVGHGTILRSGLTSFESQAIVNKTGTPLLVYPPIGGSIDGGAPNSPSTVAAHALVEFRASDTLGNFYTAAGAPTNASATVVANVSSLRALTGAFTASEVFVVGYYSASVMSPPDEGGGHFVYDASDAATADNGGTVIVDAAARRWKRPSRTYVTGKQFGAKGDGATDDAPALQSAINWLNSIGGGTLYLSAARYSLSTGLTLKSYVTIEGAGDMTELFGTGLGANAGVFWAGQIDFSTLGSFTYYSLANIAYGDKTATCTTPAQAGNFSVGQVAMIRTSGLAPNGVPKVCVFNRVIARDAATGVITFENEFLDTITSAQITDTTGGAVLGRPSGVLDRITIRNLAVYQAEMTFGSPLYISGVYESLIENVKQLQGLGLCNANGFARSMYRNVYGSFRYSMIEAALGSHDSTWENISGSHDGTPPTAPFGGFLISVVEHPLRCTLRGIRVYAPDYTPDPALTGSSLISLAGSGHHLSDFDIYANWSVNLGGLIGINSGYVPTGDIVVEDIRMKVTNFSRSVLMVQSPAATDQIQNFKMRNCELLGTPSDCALLITSGTPQIYLDNNKFEHGGFEQSSADGPALGKVIDCEIESWSQTAGQWDKMKKIGNIRAGSAGVYAQDLTDFQRIITTVVPNTVQYSYAIPVSQKLQAKDRVLLKLNGRINGAGANAKRLVVTDGTNTLLDVNTTAASKGFTVELELYLYVTTIVQTTATFTLDGSAPVIAAGAYIVPDITTNGYTMALQGWVADAADPYVIDTISWEFRPYGE